MMKKKNKRNILLETLLKSLPPLSLVRVKTNPDFDSNTFYVPANSGELVRTQLHPAREILELLLNSFVIMLSKDHNNKQQYGMASRIVKFAQILTADHLWFQRFLSGCLS